MGATPTRGFRAPHFDETMHGGRCVAGSPATVVAALRAQLAEAGVNYCVGRAHAILRCMTKRRRRGCAKLL